ncbi:hypothetical protein JL108_17975 [Aeromicrobium sp. YIM 150415]|uniref:hypothetical protein n=1 Tax=Aeromicrobium sp. YIM 150415 TaxID=2803912 RepID=UPI001964B264|nr:hypothetical protein [Aeromicrobium sp. YIM 150415]MBM9465342.1 hypothetical protein [Aeromicrobium sp. YIM 150415]
MYFYTEHDGNPALVTLQFKAPEGVYVWPIVEFSPDVMRDLVKEPHSGARRPQHELSGLAGGVTPHPRTISW